MQTEPVYSDENLDCPCFAELRAFECILGQTFSTLTGLIKYTKISKKSHI